MKLPNRYVALRKLAAAAVVVVVVAAVAAVVVVVVAIVAFGFDFLPPYPRRLFWTLLS